MAKRPLNQPPSKEEQKFREREEQLKREAEQLEAARKQKEEAERVRKEAYGYRLAIDELQRRILRSGEDIQNWFNLFDHDRSGYLEPDDFKRLLKHAQVVVRDDDLLKVFELIDLQQSGKISYKDFLNVVKKNVTLPIEEIVRKRRRARGEAFIEGAGPLLDPLYQNEEEERMRAYKSHYGEYSST